MRRRLRADAVQRRPRGRGERTWRHDLLSAEVGTIVRDAPIRVALCYPSPYRVAMSSLGYQVIYRLLNSRPGVAAERVVLPEPGTTDGAEEAVSIETGRPLGSFDLIAFSVAYDLEISGFFTLMAAAGIPFERAARSPSHPPILLGGPLTASNALPFGPFIDLAVIGDGEVAVERLVDLLDSGVNPVDLARTAAGIAGVWVPVVDGDAVPATQKVAASHLPAYGQIVTQNTELRSMFLVEASRGCPRFCKFCLVRAPESPMREPDVEQVLATIPEHARRVGFVGAAVSEYSGIRELLRRVVEGGREASVSSLRADRLDEEFVEASLARGGYRTMTVASDAPSQRQRDKMAKGLRTKHLLESARLAAWASMSRIKLYVIVGLPDENDDDLAELVELANEMSTYLPVALGVSPLVPKLHTPLGDAPFAGIRENDRTLRWIRESLGPRVELRATSARWSWVEYRMSQGGQDAGRAALEAWRNGGKFADWKAAMAKVDERGGLDAARRHALFDAAGMR